MTMAEVARLIGASPASVCRWLEDTGDPSPSTRDRIFALARGEDFTSNLRAFASHGAAPTPKYEKVDPDADPPIRLLAKRNETILDRLYKSGRILEARKLVVSAPSLPQPAPEPAPTPSEPLPEGISAGKNTYTYDAHTYHTKVPPQGIAEILNYYLPEGGLVLDPFAGSGMTGVAARVTGHDCILNELSPAACFISERFVATVDVAVFDAAVKLVLQETAAMRARLYQTKCRECGASAEVRYTVWAFRVECTRCAHEFNIWDVCRRYGRTVRDHKILSEFDCPGCGTTLKKRALPRSVAEPVMLGYICCGHKRNEVTHPPTPEDLEQIRNLEKEPLPAELWYPTSELPDGVNLRQPKKHGN